MDPDKKILLEHGQYIVYDDCLGEGSFGSVYSGYDKQKELPIAVKRITNASIAFSQKEIDVLMKLKEHDNVVRLLGHFQMIGMNWLVTELLRGLTLDAFMEKRNPDIEIKLELAEQLFLGLKYIHNSDPAICHRDLKPLNILIVRGHQLKLLDFGLARQMEGTMYAASVQGSLSYMAPEIFRFTKYNPFKVDVYAAGLLLLAIATFQVGKKMDHLFAPAYGVALGQLMLQEGNGDMLIRKIDGLNYPCQQTMKLIRLAKTMVTFQPSSRPDMNSVFHSLTGIMRQVATSGDQPNTRETRTTDATPDATREKVLPGAKSSAHDGARPKVPSASKPKTKKVATSGDQPNTRETRTTTREKVLPGATSSAQDGARPKVPSASKPKTKKVGARPKVPSASKPKTKKDHGNGDDVSTVADKLASKDIHAGVPRSLSRITSHELGYKASQYVGFGFSHDVLIGHEAKLYLFQFNCTEYTQAWEKKAPANMNEDCDKAITRDREIMLQQNTDLPTILYSHRLQRQKKFERSGRLMDCSEKGEVSYSVKKPSGGWRIELFGLSKEQPSDKKPVMTIRPPAGQSDWGGVLSVCRARSRIVVTECWTHSLDIFTSEGKHILHKDYSTSPYLPAFRKAVSRCGDADYVMVGEHYPPAAVHVYDTLTGEEAATFSCKQLGLGEHMFIWGLRCCDGVLHIAAGSFHHVTFLHAYKVEFSDK